MIFGGILNQLSGFLPMTVIYRKILNKKDKKLQKDVDRLGKWAVENYKINPSKRKAIFFTRTRVKCPANFSLNDTLMPEISSCKYLGIILRIDFSWAD
jgi:hypothetical protein